MSDKRIFTLTAHTVSSFLSAFLCLVTFAICQGAGQPYGLITFCAAPFLVGVIAGVVAPRYGIFDWHETLAVAAVSVCACGVGFLVAGKDGLICIVMAAPLAFAMAAAGAACVYFSHTIDKTKNSLTITSSLLLAPALFAGSIFVPQQESVHAVTTELEIAAAPKQVWENVIHFRDLPEPTELLFRVGLAYPKRAEIVGTGVGAIRYCEFSTGPFVEPIKVWDEPRLLQFSVTHNPEPLRELSIYKSVHPAHLNGYFASRRDNLS